MEHKKDKKAYVVTHTHWDREWRYPLWENRMKLVELMEELLEVLDTNEGYRSYLLDGQCVMIEDYLKVKPQDKDRIMKYVKEGRLSIGPWYSLPDLYPIDGECLVRNLLKGIRYSDSLGGHLNVAYESFGWGQTAQFPQIYKEFGLDTVIVAKNVSKDRAPNSEFMWESPDGTQVLATRLGECARANFFMNSYIPIMYGMPYLSEEFRYKWGTMGMVYHQGDENNYYRDYFKMDDTGVIHDNMIKESIQVALNSTEATVCKSHRVLMNGSDSTTSQPEIVNIIKKANECFDDVEFIHASIEEYVDKLKELIDIDKLNVVKGELRDGPANSCSANALATRPYIKMLNKKVQNELLYTAEPLSIASCMLGTKYEKEFLDIAIKYMLLSHAHDSINGVTQDKTVEDVLYMLNQSLEIGQVISNTACKNIIKNIDMSKFKEEDILFIAINPTSRQRREIAKVYADIPQEYNVWDFKIEDQAGNTMDLQHVERYEQVTPVDDLHSRPWPFYSDRHCFYFDTDIIPAGGYKVYKLVPDKKFNRDGVFWPQMRKSSGINICDGVNTLENEFLKVIVGGNGSINVYDKSMNKWYKNLNYFEDTGDCGDYWIYFPPYNNKTYNSLGSSSRIWVEDNGPISATIGAEIKMILPAYGHRAENGIKGESKRSAEEKEVCITCYYTLKKDSKKVDVKLKIDNTVENHRMRVMFDSEINAKNIDAAGHFTVDQRPINPMRDNTGEYYPEMQTLPQQYFVDISDGNNGLGIINNCFTEYEAINNDKNTVAITLFRSVKNIICTEFRSAGVFNHQKGGQSQGGLEFNYAIYPHSGNWEQSDIYEMAQNFNVPLKIIQTCRNKGGILPLEQSFYKVEPKNLIMTTFKKAEDRDSYIMRLYNPTGDIIEGEICLYTDIKKANLVNLNEQVLKKLDVVNQHSVHIKVENNKIVTIEFIV